MSRRTLTDEQWERIAGYLPGREGTRGRSGVNNRLFVDAILWMAGDAARWRDLPEVFGKWTGVHARFRRWSHAGVWERLFHSLSVITPTDVLAMVRRVEARGALDVNRRLKQLVSQIYRFELLPVRWTRG